MALIAKDKDKKRDTDLKGIGTDTTSDLGGQKAQLTPEKQSSGYVNLQRYLSASQPGRTVKAIETKGKEKIGDVSAAGQGLIKSATEGMSGIGTYTEDDLKDISKSSEKFGGILNWEGVEIPEITSQPDYMDFSTKEQETGQLINSLQSPSSYGTALSLIAGPQYSKGSSALDTALVAATPEATGMFKGLKTNLDTTTEGIDKDYSRTTVDRANKLSIEGKAIQDNLREGLRKAGSDIYEDLRKDLITEESRVQTLPNALKDKYGMTSEQLREKMESLKDPNKVYGDVNTYDAPDAESFISIPKVGIENVITQKQYDDFQTLANLGIFLPGITDIKPPTDLGNVTFDQAKYDRLVDSIVDDFLASGYIPEPIAPPQVDVYVPHSSPDVFLDDISNNRARTKALGTKLITTGQVNDNGKLITTGQVNDNGKLITRSSK